MGPNGPLPGGVQPGDPSDLHSGAMATFHVKFLGCKVSQADAMQARSALLEAGHIEAPEAEADLHVVNTCCITREAEAKSRQSVRRSAGGRVGRRVVVTGCAANLNAAQFEEIAPEVTALVGTADDVAEEVAGAAAPGCIDLDTGPVPGTPLSLGRTRGFVKVQDGCDCHCSYCIIPKVRGGARSRPASAVLREARRRVEQGQPEMVMTGISVGDYRDPERGLELGDLMRAVAAVEGVERVRLSSVEVIHVRDSLLDALATDERICPHLHVPLQSGDDAVLASMGRHYDSAGYLAAIARLRERVPHVNLTTDVIVGYPTEDEAAFERTLELVRAAGTTRVHTFSFSPRPGTDADRFGDPVAPQEKKRRSRELRGLSEALSRRHRATKLGTVDEVLVDKVAAEQVSGYSRDYTRWYLPAGRAAAGETVCARAGELYSDGIAGMAA
jgi:threonylcarbamoyladenosine tRNA methylthiotransferase MtaB